MTDKGERRVLVVAEREGSKIAFLTYELLRAGKELASKRGGIVCAAILGHDIGGIAHELGRFADQVYALDHPPLADFHGDLYERALHVLCQEIAPDILLMGHSLESQDLAPRLACALGVPLVTDCIRLDIGSEGELLCDKPIYGDNAVATLVMEKRPRMVTVRPKVMDALQEGFADGTVISFDPGVDPSMIRTESVETIPGEVVSLDKADAIVAGGRGIKEREGLRRLDDLIEVLKRFFSAVELGASRPLVDSGWLPPSRQLGLTGEKASPGLYIAIGISGASQHLSGIIGSKKIVAINKDAEAPIFRSADYGVVGEYEAILPSFIKGLRELP